MGKVEILRIRAICTYEGEEEDAPCFGDVCDVCFECLQENCQYLLIDEGEIEE